MSGDSGNDSHRWDAMSERGNPPWREEVGSNPSWRWSDHHGRHVLIEDGETTTDDLAAARAEGWGNPVAEADYWVMVATMTVAAAARRVTQAREADAQSPTFDNLLAVTDAERNHGDAVTIHDAMLDAADDARAHEAGERARVVDLVRDAERIARAAPDSRETHPESEIARQANTELDDAWREAVTITNSERLIEYGNDGPYESDRSLPPEDRERRDNAITHISEQTGVPQWYVKGEMLDAVHAYFRAYGTDDDPDYFAPPDWTDLTQRYTAYEALLDDESHHMTTGVADDLFDDDVSDEEQKLARDDSHTTHGASEPALHRETNTVADHQIRVVDDALTATRDNAVRGHDLSEAAVTALLDSPAARRVVEGAADRATAPVRVNTHDELQSRLDDLRAQVHHGAAPEVDERGGGESPGKPRALEAVASAHSAVLATDRTTRHDSAMASASNPLAADPEQAHEAGDGR
ncbi:MAG: hypothetical protein ABIZ05_05725 [Pseudonocardiaceae bacterium]